MILDILSEKIWGIPMILLMIITGAYFTVGTGFFQIRNFTLIFSETLGSLFKKKHKSKAGVSPFQAMSTALAGTIGTGNIAGVATALVAGGPGAVFWMWVSAFLGMMTKFAEVALAVKFREKDSSGEYRGGPMYTIVNGLGERFRPLANIFALLCALASFGIGNMAQVNAISLSLKDAFQTPVLATGIVTALLILIVVSGGIKRIANFTGLLVPFMSLFYILGTVAVIAVNIDSLIPAMSLIFKGAFSFTSFAGGAAGYSVAAAMRFGVARGIFTNEAGLGSAPIAHAAANTTPLRQGMWGAIEVFIDTIVVCTLTALVILTSKVFFIGGLDGAALTSAAFSEVFGRNAAGFLAVSIALFAFASMLGWCFYGEQCCKFLRPNHQKSAVRIYRLMFALAALAGSFLQLKAVWNLSDILNGLMILPNIIALLFLSRHVFEIEKNERI